jgi:hypothetical protein
MGWVAGTPHEDVWQWWMAVHHNLVVGGAGSVMHIPVPGMSSVLAPSATAAPASSSAG